MNIEVRWPRRIGMEVEAEREECDCGCDGSCECGVESGHQLEPGQSDILIQWMKEYPHEYVSKGKNQEDDRCPSVAVHG